MLRRTGDDGDRGGLQRIADRKANRVNRGAVVRRAMTNLQQVFEFRGGPGRVIARESLAPWAAGAERAFQGPHHMRWRSPPQRASATVA